MNSEEETSEKIEIIPFLGMALFIVVIQIIALLMAHPFEVSNIQAFEDPEAVSNPFVFIVMILAFTLVVLTILKLKKGWMIHAFMLFVVATTMYYVFIALSWNNPLSISLAIALTAIMYKYPEWYLIDAVAIIIGAGAASIFGISLAVLPALILLAILAVYDALSVYKTKHMVSLAEGVLELKLPILFVIPRRRGFSFLKPVELRKGDAYFMGLGDAVIPTILVVSAYRFMSAPSLGFLNIPALGAMIGSLIGYAGLMFFVGRGEAHAGLPFLNSGAILGFLVASIASGSLGSVLIL